LKLADGEDLFESLKACAAESGIRSAIVLTGIGMLKEFELGYFDGRAYRNEAHSEARELVALHGSITTEGGFVAHLHAALAGPDHGLVGGHLHKAKVCVVNEITILRIDGSAMTRVTDENTNLKLLHLGS
jgi:hypothetical protein